VLGSTPGVPRTIDVALPLTTSVTSTSVSGIDNPSPTALMTASLAVQRRRNLSDERFIHSISRGQKNLSAISIAEMRARGPSISTPQGVPLTIPARAQSPECETLNSQGIGITGESSEGFPRIPV